jgi:Domain of unknown function (DUF4864)
MHLVRIWMAVTALLFQIAGSPAGAGEAIGAMEAAAIREVVQRQLEAFRRDDGAGTFGFASPGIRAQFATPERFMAMVRHGYEPVYRPREVEFRDIVDDRGHPARRVLLERPDGRSVLAYDVMERQGDGSWPTDGCVLVEVDRDSV